MSRIRLAALVVTALLGALALPAGASANLGFSNATGSPFATADEPEGVATGDFNEDGRDDVLVGTRDGAQKVNLLLADPEGSLADAPGSPFTAGHNLPACVLVADVNGDGHQDAVTGAAVGGNNGKVAVLLGDGKGGLTPAPGSPYAMNSDGVSGGDGLGAGDFNGDGHLDIVGAGGAKISLLLGTGTGALAPGVTTAVPGNPGTTADSVAVADFTGDGRPDAITGDYLPGPGQTAVLFRNTGAGLAAFVTQPNAGYHVAAGDINGDGRSDVVFSRTGPDDLPTFLLGGGGAFAALPGSPFDSGIVFAFGTHLADLDADGNLDIEVAGEDKLALLQGSGTGTFASFTNAPISRAGTHRHMVTGDIDGDAQPDLVYTSSDTDRVGVMRNNGVGGVGAPASVAFGAATVGQGPVDRTITLTSNGSGFLRVAAATVTGADAGDVTKLADGCSGRRLIVGATCDITLRFAPAAAGERAAALTLADNSPNGGHEIPLTGQGTAAPAPPAADTTRPVVSALSFAPRAFRVGKKATATIAKTKKTATGTKLRFTLSEAAAVRITVQRATTGRRSGGACRKATAKLRKAKRCTRYVTVGTLKRSAKPGRVTVGFTGRVGKKALKRGNHRVSITATDTAGNRTAKAATRTFKVVR